MEASRALADLVEISSQIESAVLADGSGEVLASTLANGEGAQEIVRDALALLAGAGEPAQLEAALPEGSVFVVRDEERLVVAVTGRQPTSGLVLYDLKTCLRLAGDEAARPAKKAAASPRRRAKKKDEGNGDGEA